MDKFEKTNKYPEIKKDYFFYARCIDHIFIGGEKKLNNFQTSLNLMHGSIKFDLKDSSHSITFLDTISYTDQNK